MMEQYAHNGRNGSEHFKYHKRQSNFIVKYDILLKTFKN
jgi:hypothetical protein